MPLNSRTAEQETPPAQASEETIPNGAAAAAILSAGAGACALGILSVVADGSKTIGQWLGFYRPSGPLSGVTTVAVLIWLAVWFVLSKVWRSKSVNLAKTNALAYFLLACGLLLTFPPFADLLLRK